MQHLDRNNSDLNYNNYQNPNIKETSNPYELELDARPNKDNYNYEYNANYQKNNPMYKVASQRGNC